MDCWFNLCRLDTHKAHTAIDAKFHDTPKKHIASLLFPFTHYFGESVSEVLGLDKSWLAIDTHLSRIEFPTAINWTSPYPF